MDVCDKTKSYANRPIKFEEILYDQCKISGNYMIYNSDGKSIYSGQSCNILERLAVHRKWVGCGWFARIINLEDDLDGRLLFEDIVHENHPELISNPRNGKLDDPRMFDGVIYDSAKILYKHIKTHTGISSPTARSYIEEGSDTLADLVYRKEQSRLCSTRSIIKSNIRRAGKPLNMKTKVCPHCGLVGKGGNMPRYHFDNCKHKEV